MSGERLLPEGTMLRIDPNADTDRKPARPSWSYSNRPEASCPGAFVPRFVGGPNVRVLCSTRIDATVGLCPRCSAIEADVRRRLKERAMNAAEDRGARR